MNRLQVRCVWGDSDALDIAQIGIAGGELLLQFSDGYLDSGLDLAPLRLRPSRELYRHPLRDPFGPLPGLLDDTMPDTWGQRVMDRHLTSQGVPDPTLLQRLAWLGDTTMGALTYHPAGRDDPDDPIAVDLAATADAAAQLIEGVAFEVLDVIARAGGSPGGARPKVVVGLDDAGRIITGATDLPEGYEAWMVKFAAPSDPEDTGRIEHAYLRMARAAGLVTVDSRLLTDATGRRHIAVRRFDRVGQGRATARRHASTVSGLLHANHRLPSTDYESVLRLTRRLTSDQRDVVQVFRLAVFNVVAHNRDDHSKNVSFIAQPNGQWAVAPAYDLTHSTGAGGEHATAVAGKGRDITRDDLRLLARPAGLTATEADALIDQVGDAVGRWRDFAEAAGVTPDRADDIGSYHQGV